ncbi:MAG: alpha-xylosidase [Clostridiales bacterium]|nr:alpha-xylosidase [Clostridiales bacterium]
MKFTNGYWLTKPEFRMLFATQCVRASQEGRELVLLAAGCPVRHRGDVLAGGALEVRFSAPRANIVRVRITHFAGAADPGPHFSTLEENFSPEIRVTEDQATLCSGDLTVRVLRTEGRWQVDYLDRDGRILTSSGFRGMARALLEEDGPASLEKHGKSYMIDSLDLGVGETVYGLGERFGAYVRNGQSVTMWNADGGTASELAYKNIPFYMTNRGYGVFVEDASDVSFEVASEKVERVQFSVPGERLTYDVIYGGSPKETLNLYTALTGRPALPPAWSFGLWLSTSFTTSYDEATVSSFIDGMAERDIPLSVFHFDCYWMRAYNWCDFVWDPDVFPDPEGMLKRYHDRGLHLCCWINPYVGQASPLFAEGTEKGYFLKTRDGSVWQTDLWQAGMAVLDVTNPAARDWYCNQIRRVLKQGIDCLKTDFGERIPVRDIVYYDGSDPLRMHNYYTFLYNQMIFDLLKQEKGEGEAILFARSATAGGQQFPVHWGGDNSASYVSMAETLRAGLSMSHSGFGFWSHDISGFESTAPADVYKRWAAFGLLSSHSRLHGSSSYRVPWLFDEESVDVVRKFTKLKCTLMPYLYQMAVEAHRQGAPMMRPMMMEFPDDPACEYLDRQYMLGDRLLVAPVFDPEGEVTYYLPEGDWYHLLTGEKVRGGGWRKEKYDFLSLPLLVKGGTVLPVGACDSRPDYDYAQNTELRAYGLKDGQTFSLEIPTVKGDLDSAVTVTRRGNDLQVESSSGKAFRTLILD